MRSDNPDKPPFADTDLLSEMPEGIRFRQAEVWAGLEDTLARRRRRAVVLRLSVAATLLLALTMGWWLHGTQKPGAGIARQQPAHTPLSPSVSAPASAAATVAASTPTPVEIRKAPAQQPTTVPSTPAPGPAPELIASLPPSIDTPEAATALAMATEPAAPARRRFRISHMNDKTPPEPVLLTDAPADDRSNYGLIQIPINAVAGPNAGSSEYVERKPRTLMSLFKPHQ